MSSCCRFASSGDSSAPIKPARSPEFVHHLAIDGRMLADVEPRRVKAEHGDLIEPRLHLVRRHLDVAVLDEHVANQLDVGGKLVGRRVAAGARWVVQIDGRRLLQPPANHAEPATIRFEHAVIRQFAHERRPLAARSVDSLFQAAAQAGDCRREMLSESASARRFSRCACDRRRAQPVARFGP